MTPSELTFHMAMVASSLNEDQIIDLIKENIEKYDNLKNRKASKEEIEAQFFTITYMSTLLQLKLTKEDPSIIAERVRFNTQLHDSFNPKIG